MIRLEESWGKMQIIFIAKNTQLKLITETDYMKLSLLSFCSFCTVDQKGLAI